MACRASLRTVLFTDLLRPFPRNRTLSLPLISYQSSKSSFTSGYEISRVRAFRRAVCLKCSYHEGPSSSQDDHEQGPPQEAVLKAISEVSKAEGRVGQTTNVIIGGTVTDDSTNEWLALDQKMTGARSSRKYALNAFTGTLGLVLEDNVNSYPTVRDFTAIGTGGDDFVQAMIVAVESVLQHPIPEGRVKHKLSSRGKYISVNIGPVQVVSSEQVQAVYNAMKNDDRMKYFL